jgi:hypothetical protein
MNKTKLLLLALAGLFAASCVADVAEEQSVAAEAQAAKKFVNTPEAAAEGELIIYVDEATAQQLEAAEVATRSGVMPLDNLAVEVGATEIKPVFNLAVNGDVKRARGMHRWYTMSFPAETPTTYGILLKSAGRSPLAEVRSPIPVSAAVCPLNAWFPADPKTFICFRCPT